MNLDKTKETFQLTFAKKWVENKYIGTAEMATGTGKTFASFQCVLSALRDGVIKEGDTILVLAETTAREKDFFDDLKKFDSIYKKKLSKKFHWEFACYQSAYKWKNRHYPMVISDEIHDSLTLEYSAFYKNNTYSALVGLSATVERNTPLYEDSPYTKGDLLDKYCPSIYKITQSEAIEHGIIANYELWVYMHTLDDKEKCVSAGTKVKPFKTTEKAAYDYYDSQFKRALFLPEGKSKTYQIRNASARRAKILYNLPSKLKIMKKLVDIPKRKVIFGNSLDALYKITPYTVSSKLDKEENKKIRQDFEDGKINTIASFKMLKQGANLSEVKFAVLHSYYSISKDYIQRVGRILRKDGNKKGIIVVLVTMGTQEEVWFRKMIQHLKGIKIREFGILGETQLIKSINDYN